MITSLKITNFKKHGHREFDLTSGLNGIFGPNYTGKTTILYAILFALGGASQVPGTNLQKKGTNTGMGVVMEFSAGGVHYRVERKKSGAYLYRIDPTTVSGPGDAAPFDTTLAVMIASGTSNVTEKIEEILGMSVKRFRQLKYAEQKKAHALLTLGAGELHKIIEELTGIDEINAALDKLKDMLLVLTGAMESAVFTDPEPCQKEAASLKATVEGLSGQSHGLEVLIGAKIHVLEELAAKKKTLTALRLEHESWKKDSSELTDKKKAVAFSLLSLQEKVDDLDLDEAVRVLEEQKNQIDYASEALKANRKLQSTLDSLEKDKVKLLASMHVNRTAITRAVKSLESYPSDLREKFEQHELLKESFLKKELEGRTAYENLQRLYRDQKCPTCFREYDGKQKVDPADMEALLTQIGEDGKQCSTQGRLARDLKSQLSAKEAELNELSRQEVVLEKEGLQLEVIESEIKTIGAVPELSTAEDALEILKTKNAACKLHHARQVEIRQDIEKLTATMQELDNKISLLPSEPQYKEQDLSDAEEWITGYMQDKENLSQSLSKAQTELATAKFNLSACKLLLNKIEQDNAVYENVHGRFNTAKQLQKYLRDNRDRYTSQVWDFFMGTASQFVSDCTNGTITQIQRTDSGQFEFIENGETMGMKDASGAQEAIMGLSVQMALAQAAQCPLDVLLVDEPTADMDAEHSMAVSALLSTKGAQIIAVSHREMDASLCNNVINLEIEV